MRPFHQNGASRSGLLAIIALAAALALVLNETQATMEEAQVDIIVRNMRTGLQVAIGERLIRGEDNRLGELLTANPIRFLNHAPEGYIGESTLADGSGSWRFDPEKRVLEYRPRHRGAFGGQEALRWRLQAAGTPAGRTVGLRLEAM
jgi:hypothetical protein